MNTHLLRSNRVACAAPAVFALLLMAQAALAQAAPGAAAAPAAAQNAGAPASATDIRDIRGPKPIASPWLIPLIGVTMLSAVGGAYAAWAWNRRRFREASKRPLDIALERLDRARPLMLTVPPRGREFSIEVSSAVRDYIESRFDLRAAHLTTDEFLHQLLAPQDSLLAGHRALLDHFLQTCDLAKFGGWKLAATDMATMWDSARRFIVESADDAGLHRTPAAAAARAVQSRTSASKETYVSLPST